LSDQVIDLYWDSTYAVAVALMTQHPQLNPEDVGLSELAALVIDLPGFRDDFSLVTDQILLDIQTVWYEEATNP